LASLACCVALAGHPRSSAHAAATEAPNDPLFKHQWQLRMLQVPRAWSVTRGRGVVVAVLDTGVAYENRGRYRRAPDLAGTRFVAGYDFVDGDAHPDDEPTRLPHTHGTHIAGVIAQTTDNGIGAAGIAPEAAIMPIRVLRPDAGGSAPTIARGLRFAADHGADVANVSIAGALSRRVLADAVAYAASKGVTVVAAAGNDGQGSVSYPAAYPEVLAVGAVSRNGRLTYYSNYGRALDLVAPAGDDTSDESGGRPDHGVIQQTLSGEGEGSTFSRGGRATFCYCFMASTSAAATTPSAVSFLA
jgi:serine protease